MTADAEDADLPLPVSSRQRAADPAAAPPQRRRRWLALLALVPVLLVAGAVIGMYFQPPALRLIFAQTGLQPGGGTRAPIAVPAELALPADVVETLVATDVLGLARLMPRGDVITVAPPYGAGDARIAEVLVEPGDRLAAGAVVARLDNRAQLESAVSAARAEVAVREAALAQTVAAVRSSFDEARAAVQQAEAAAAEAAAELERTQALAARGVATQAMLDAMVAAERQAALAVDKANATLARFAAQDPERQPDVIVVARSLDAARAELARAESDLSRAVVRAPVAGTVLDVLARPGERPPADGILKMGDTTEMMAEVEIYQDRIAAVAPGQPVELVAMAIGATLHGHVERIGLIVGRQGLLPDDTAANTDARVVTVTVALTPESTVIASRYTNLEVVARIDTRGGPRSEAPADPAAAPAGSAAEARAVE